MFEDLLNKFKLFNLFSFYSLAFVRGVRHSQQRHTASAAAVRHRRL